MMKRLSFIEGLFILTTVGVVDINVSKSTFTMRLKNTYKTFNIKGLAGFILQKLLISTTVCCMIDIEVITN